MAKRSFFTMLDRSGPYDKAAKEHDRKAEAYELTHGPKSVLARKHRLAANSLREAAERLREEWNKSR